VEISRRRSWSRRLAGTPRGRARFDPERGIKFSTFAAYRISGAILDYLSRAPMIHLPRARRQLAEIDRARQQLERLGQGHR
jgi:DNA-directed RNA polymerase specialized sigma subunit